MRQPLPPDKRNRAFGISFPPDLKEAARRRAYQLEISLSRYLQRLVEQDLGACVRQTIERPTARRSSVGRKGIRHGR